jgi:hypothetical protein
MKHAIVCYLPFFLMILGITVAYSDIIDFNQMDGKKPQKPFHRND